MKYFFKLNIVFRFKLLFNNFYPEWYRACMDLERRWAEPVERLNSRLGMEQPDADCCTDLWRRTSAADH